MKLLQELFYGEVLHPNSVYRCFGIGISEQIWNEDGS